MTETAALRPPLKWAGGKRWLIPHLAPLWQPYRERRLVEPFCGGLAVALGLAPASALLNDINPHVINFYRWVQRGLVIDLDMRNERDLYYRHRARFNALVAAGDAENREAAQLFYYLNRTGYNGLCRFNRKGEFNVPFGRHKQIHYAADFLDYRPVLAAWEFTSVRFDELAVQPDDFIYADPPYDVEFTQYAATPFGWAEQVALAEWLARHPGPVALSNQATERIIELYERLAFELRFLDGPRMISRTGNRTPAREVLAIRNGSPPTV